MWSCRNLEELYLTGYQCCDTQRPDMSTVWPTAQTLRILVLDVLQDIKTLVRPAPGPRLAPAAHAARPAAAAAHPRVHRLQHVLLPPQGSTGVSVRWHGDRVTQVVWVCNMSDRCFRKWLEALGQHHKPACCSQAFPACDEDQQTLPNLQILAVRHLCTVGHLLNVRCARDAQPDATLSPLYLTGKIGGNLNKYWSLAGLMLTGSICMHRGDGMAHAKALCASA